MESLTLYDIEPDLAKALESEAQARGKSVSETATELLIEELERLDRRREDLVD